jgi:ribosome biogenesis GTPase / thiamine phosphate phosphatase
MSALTDWGWDEAYDALLAAQTSPAPDAVAARVVGQDRDRWALRLASGAGVARITSGSYGGPLPVTGDWVVVRPGPEVADPFTLIAVLPRRSAVSRGSAGDGHGEQVLAANIDVVWIVQGLDTPVNARRLER